MGFCQNLIWGWFVNQFGYWGLFIELSVKMDLGEKAEFSSEKRNEEHMNYHSSSMSPSWQFGASNLTDQPMGLLPISTFAPNSSGDAVASSCIWGNPNSQNLGLSGSTNVGKGVAPILDTSRTGSDKEHGLDWNLPNSMPKGSAFLSQFPTDSGFIERAARFSCFTGGAFTDMLNPFSMSESMDRRFKDEQLIQVPPQVVLDDGMNLNPTSAAQSPMNDQNRNEIAKYTVVPVERGAPEGSPAEKLSRVGSFVRPVSEEKQELGVNSNESYEEASGSGGQGEPTSRKASSSKAFGLRKRKDSGQGNETDKDETPKEARETKQKNDHNQTPNAKASKHSKVNSPNSDAPKEDYIHVRARRGQATNSHSLAERVRREKISERMKYLQDLVPGCSKVTGKAVMLDEIINYVQSLQRQVEFLSMKLASVNPRLDLNTEALLAKDVREALQSRGGSSSSTFPFPQDPRLVHPQPHPSQQGFIQPRIPGMENPSDALRRTSYSQLIAINEGYKGPAAQIPNIWDDELNNVLQMNFGTSPAFNGQDSTASEPPGDMKDEL